MSKLFYLLLTFLAIPNSVMAFKFSPMIATIELDQNRRSVLGTLSNDGDYPVAIQMTPLKRDISLEGKESLTEELEDISIYPPQLIVPAKSKRAFKVTYLGKDLGLAERSFRIFAEESKVDLNPIKTASSSIKMKISYYSALYVAPKGAKSEVSVTSVYRDLKGLSLLVQNSGNRHQNLNKLKVVFEKDGKEVIVLDSQNSKDLPLLKGFSAENILAKSQRVFRIGESDRTKKIDSTYQARLVFDKD